MITCPHGAMVYSCQISMDCIAWFQTRLPAVICKMVTWQLAKDRFTFRTNICEVSSKFPSYLIVLLTIKIEVQISLCSNWNCWSYTLDIILWHRTNANKTSSKTKFPSLNLLRLLYPQTQKNEIQVSLKCSTALLFQSGVWVVAMLFSSVTTSVPAVANVTTSIRRIVHTSSGNIASHLLAYSYIAWFD